MAENRDNIYVLLQMNHLDAEIIIGIFILIPDFLYHQLKLAAFDLFIIPDRNISE